MTANGWFRQLTCDNYLSEVAREQCIRASKTFICCTIRTQSPSVDKGIAILRANTAYDTWSIGVVFGSEKYDEMGSTPEHSPSTQTILHTRRATVVLVCLVAALSYIAPLLQSALMRNLTDGMAALPGLRDFDSGVDVGTDKTLASPHTGVFGRYCLIRSAGRRARCLDCVVHSCRHDRGPHRCHWSAILVRSRTSPEQHKVLGEVWAFCSVAGAMRGSICERTRYSGRLLDELEDQLSFRGSRIYHFAACDSQLV